MVEACGIKSVGRIERSRRYKLTVGASLSTESRIALSNALAAIVHDRMTECVYVTALTSFDNGAVCEPVVIVPLLEEGKEALRRLNEQKGLGTYHTIHAIHAIHAIHMTLNPSYALLVAAEKAKLLGQGANAGIDGKHSLLAFEALIIEV